MVTAFGWVPPLFSHYVHVPLPLYVEHPRTEARMPRGLLDCGSNRTRSQRKSVCSALEPSLPALLATAIDYRNGGRTAQCRHGSPGGKWFLAGSPPPPDGIRHLKRRSLQYAAALMGRV